MFDFEKLQFHVTFHWLDNLNWNTLYRKDIRNLETKKGPTFIDLPPAQIVFCEKWSLQQSTQKEGKGAHRRRRHAETCLLLTDGCKSLR